jgi:hypothetical protein
MPMTSLRRHPVAWPLAAALLLAIGWAALAPLRYANHDQLLEIDQGTAARRRNGDQALMLPSAIRLTLGVQDVLLLRNRDTMGHAFGPVLLEPGQDFRLPFEQAADYAFASSAHGGRQVVVTVVPLPDPGWERLRWRLAALMHAVRYLKPQPPSAA